MQLHLSENVSTDAIWQFYSKPPIINDEADSVYESDRSFDCYWMKPILGDSVALGDANGDGQIDASDVSFILGIYAKLSTGCESGHTDDQFAAADINFDKKIDSNGASAPCLLQLHLNRR